MGTKQNLLQELQNKRRLQAYISKKNALQTDNSSANAMAAGMQNNVQSKANEGWMGNQYLTNFHDVLAARAASSGNKWAQLAAGTYYSHKLQGDLLKSRQLEGMRLANQANVHEMQNGMNDYNRRLNNLDSAGDETTQRLQMNDNAKIADTLNDKLQARLMPQSAESFGSDYEDKNQELMQNAQEMNQLVEQNKEMRNAQLKENLMNMVGAFAGAAKSAKAGNNASGKGGEAKTEKNVSGKVMQTEGFGHDAPQGGFEPIIDANGVFSRGGMTESAPKINIKQNNNTKGSFTGGAAPIQVYEPGTYPKENVYVPSKWRTDLRDEHYGQTPTELYYPGDYPGNKNNQYKPSLTYENEKAYNTKYYNPQPQTPVQNTQKSVSKKPAQSTQNLPHIEPVLMSQDTQPQVAQTDNTQIVDNSSGQYPLPKQSMWSKMFNRQNPNVYPTGDGDKPLPDYQTTAQPTQNVESQNPIIAYQNSLRQSGNYTDAEINGVAQGLNSGRPEIQQWLNQYNEGTGRNNPIRIPSTEEEIALARAGKFNQVPQEGQVSDNRTLKEKLLSGVQDLSAGYKENSTTPFAVENLQGVQGKSKMNKLGEALGTTSRLLANPYMQGLIAGGIYKATGGDLGESINYGVNWAQNKSKSDYYAKKMGQTPGVLTNNFDANDYKAYEQNLYNQQKLEMELDKLNEQSQYHQLTLEQKERQMQLTNEIQKLRLQNEFTRTALYGQKVRSDIANAGKKGKGGSDFNWSDYYDSPEDYNYDLHFITMGEGDPDYENAVNEQINAFSILDPSFMRLSDEEKRKRAVAEVKKDQQKLKNTIKYNTGKDITK